MINAIKRILYNAIDIASHDPISAYFLLLTVIKATAKSRLNKRFFIKDIALLLEKLPSIKSPLNPEILAFLRAKEGMFRDVTNDYGKLIDNFTNHQTGTLTNPRPFVIKQYQINATDDFQYFENKPQAHIIVETTHQRSLAYRNMRIFDHAYLFYVHALTKLDDNDIKNMMNVLQHIGQTIYAHQLHYYTKLSPVNSFMLARQLNNICLELRDHPSQASLEHFSDVRRQLIVTLFNESQAILDEQLVKFSFILLGSSSAIALPHSDIEFMILHEPIDDNDRKKSSVMQFQRLLSIFKTRIKQVLLSLGKINFSLDIDYTPSPKYDSNSHRFYNLFGTVDEIIHREVTNDNTRIYNLLALLHSQSTASIYDPILAEFRTKLKSAMLNYSEGELICKKHAFYYFSLHTRTFMQEQSKREKHSNLHFIFLKRHIFRPLLYIVYDLALYHNIEEILLHNISIYKAIHILIHREIISPDFGQLLKVAINYIYILRAKIQFHYEAQINQEIVWFDEVTDGASDVLFADEEFKHSHPGLREAMAKPYALADEDLACMNDIISGFLAPFYETVLKFIESHNYEILLQTLHRTTFDLQVLLNQPIPRIPSIPISIKQQARIDNLNIHYNDHTIDNRDSDDFGEDDYDSSDFDEASSYDCTDDSDQEDFILTSEDEYYLDIEETILHKKHQKRFNTKVSNFREERRKHQNLDLRKKQHGNHRTMLGEFIGREYQKRHRKPRAPYRDLQASELMTSANGELIEAESPHLTAHDNHEFSVGTREQLRALKRRLSLTIFKPHTASDKDQPTPCKTTDKTISLHTSASNITEDVEQTKPSCVSENVTPPEKIPSWPKYQLPIDHMPFNTETNLTHVSPVSDLALQITQLNTSHREIEETGSSSLTDSCNSWQHILSLSEPVTDTDTDTDTVTLHLGVNHRWISFLTTPLPESSTIYAHSEIVKVRSHDYPNSTIVIALFDTGFDYAVEPEQNPYARLAQAFTLLPSLRSGSWYAFEPNDVSYHHSPGVIIHSPHHETIEEALQNAIAEASPTLTTPNMPGRYNPRHFKPLGQKPPNTPKKLKQPAPKPHGKKQRGFKKTHR